MTRGRPARWTISSAAPLGPSSGNLAQGGRQAGRPGQAVRPRPAGAAARPGIVRGGRPAGQRAPADDLPADGVVTGRRHDRRAAGVRDGQRPDREGRLVGRSHGREDRAAHRVRAAPRAAGVLAGRLGRRPHHRPGPAVPGPPRRGAHLRQPGAAVGQGAAGLLPVRTVGRRRRLHPELLRRRRSWSRATRRCTSARPAWPRR